MSEALDRLIEAVERPAAIRRSWASDVFERKHLARYVDFAANGGSLDAAKALHDALLPGWVFVVSEGSASVLERGNGFATMEKHYDDNPARA